MVDAVSGVTGSQTQTSSITSIKDLEENPEFFPIWVEEIQRRNVNLLLSATNVFSDTDSNDDSLYSSLGSYNGLSGSSSGTSDIFSALGLTSSTDSALSSLFSTQGITSDFSFLSSTTALQSYQVEETLRGLQAYTNATENLKWVGQIVEYVDPADGLTKTGRVTRVDIENVQKPLFRIDDKFDLTLDEIKSITAV
ncbi:hypothetical protein NO1_0106 [Candidatus Termititenax aidoneus]|uniref:Uncharacterized protein n=1 Tax=Termititenax aidoneus TaxID=2218524 RepID=A0A388T8B0_TERA1|nr:hypothetical protein NO1_0106 [Candidatus Termititenax aidoneus]